MSKAKEILFDEDARNALRDGIDQLANVVAITLGPRGRNVGLQASWGSPTITSDGNSIAKDVELKDVFLNMGVSLGKEVAAKIKEKIGGWNDNGDHPPARARSRGSEKYRLWSQSDRHQTGHG